MTTSLPRHFRVADAIALAVRVKTRIFVDDDVMDRAGLALDNQSAVPAGDVESEPGGPAPDDARLTVFRDFQ